MLGFDIDSRRDRVLVCVLAAVTVACWFGWMGWDVSRDVDPATGRETGPYEPWQVVGCVVTLMLIGLAAARWLPLMPIGLTMPTAFTAGWSASAIPSDDQGLWLAGAMLVFAGMLIGTFVIVGPARLLWSARARRRLRTALRGGVELYRHPPFDP